MANEIARQADVEWSSFLDQLKKVRPIDVLHDQVMQSIGLAEVVNGNDIWMAEPGQGAGFAGESFRESRIAAAARRETRASGPV